TAFTTSLLLLTGCAANQQPVDRALPSVAIRYDEGAVIERDLQRLEEEYDARIGLQIIDTGTGQQNTFRANEEFGFASSIKALVVAVLLAQTTERELSQRLVWTQSDVDKAGYSPVTELHVADGMTLAELAEATVRFSDNTALNVIL